MCNQSGIDFGKQNLTTADVAGKRVLEIGARTVNFSLRTEIEKLKPAEYIGVDIQEGKGVDQIVSAEELVDKFGADSFDVVFTTELLEHVEDWRAAISNIKQVCKPNGVILITTRSIGFKYHAFPYDFWRYEKEDMQEIFADCEVEVLESDPSEPGVFVKVRKTTDFQEKDLSQYKLFNIITKTREVNIPEGADQKIVFKLRVWRTRSFDWIYQTARFLLGRERQGK
ncbi:class I SAM-dependent methyltransferase [Patescibacteria group bacterium]